jgi:cytochrome c biogenesis protein CcmG/thiol:disulfide interchange protein DsbE
MARPSRFNRLAPTLLRRYLRDDHGVAQERSSSRARPARWSRRGLAATLLVGLFALLIYGLTAQSPNATIDDSLSRGLPTKAPPFRLDTLQAGALGSALAPKLTGDVQRRSIALSELRGTPVVLNFWASWCVPCQEEAPMLERTWRQRARPRGVLFLGIDTQDTPSDARTFMRHYAIEYPNIRDPSEDVLRSYGTTRLPQTFFIDRRGQIVGHVFGVSSPQQLVDGITAAVAGRVRGAQEGGVQATDAVVSSLLAGIQQRGNTLGDPKAPVTVQYFGDLQCPYCAQFTLRVLPSLIESYVRSGKLKIEYRSLRTATRQPGVFEAQEIAALAAGRQNKMWNFIELFYHEQGREHSGYVTKSYVQGLAQQVSGLNLIEWTAAQNDPELARTLTTDAEAASSAGINGTPQFLVVKTGPRPPYLAAIETLFRGRPFSKAGK